MGLVEIKRAFKKAGLKNNYTATNVRETRMLQLFQLGFNEIEAVLDKTKQTMKIVVTFKRVFSI